MKGRRTSPSRRRVKRHTLVKNTNPTTSSQFPWLFGGVFRAGFSAVSQAHRPGPPHRPKFKHDTIKAGRTTQRGQNMGKAREKQKKGFTKVPARQQKNKTTRAQHKKHIFLPRGWGGGGCNGAAEEGYREKMSKPSDSVHDVSRATRSTDCRLHRYEKLAKSSPTYYHQPHIGRRCAPICAARTPRRRYVHTPRKRSIELARWLL